jgi:Mn2+/Fe2+ NRAMP family transporter
MSDSSRAASSSSPPDDNTIPPEFDPATNGGTLDPPRTIGGTLRKLGPGLIIAGSIVGSGELIATTKTGAQAGITLLWLIIVGCLIKVFVQIELGRITISDGETTLAVLNRVPGRLGPVNWILWFWLAMMSASIAQLGGIVGGVGQALALSFPISGDYRAAIEMPSAAQLEQYLQWDEVLDSQFDHWLDAARVEEPDAFAHAFNDPPGPVTKRVREWLREQTDPGIRESKGMTFDEGQEFMQAYYAALPGHSEQSPAELEQHRAAFRALLRTRNASPFEAAVRERQADGRLPKDLDTTQRDQILRGHEILAEGFVDAARRGARERIVHALVCQMLVSETAAAHAALPVSSADRSFAALDLAHAKERVKQLTEPSTWDDKWWAAVVTAITIALLYNGRYGIVEYLSTILVVMFTFVTVGNVCGLQSTEQWHLSADTLLKGLSFGMPEGGKGLAMALATFGIIGVGATELISYPYWCIEKGYARYTGWRTPDEAWAVRARGWMRVMHWDAFISMVIYTIATIAFYLTGVAVLHSEGRDPDGMRMVSTLASAYVPVFGEYAKWLFLIGAFAVLYSTFLVANAGHSRMFTDGLKVFGLLDRSSQRAHNRSISFFCVALPLISLAIFWSGINPVTAVATAGMMQATMLPMIGFAALYSRWTATDTRLSPPVWWDVLLVLSFVGLLVVGVYGLWSKLAPLLLA